MYSLASNFHTKRNAKFWQEMPKKNCFTTRVDFLLTIPRQFICCSLSLFVRQWFHTHKQRRIAVDRSQPLEDCDSGLWHFLGIFTYTFYWYDLSLSLFKSRLQHDMSTLSALQTKTYILANSVDPDETARNEHELSYHDLLCLSSCCFFFHWHSDWQQ